MKTDSQVPGAKGSGRVLSHFTSISLRSPPTAEQPELPTVHAVQVKASLKMNAGHGTRGHRGWSKMKQGNKASSKLGVLGSNPILLRRTISAR